MTVNPVGGPNRDDDPTDTEKDATREQREHPGTPADTGSVAGESPKDDPDEEGEDRFDAG
jgi:hypothetical protein